MTNETTETTTMVTSQVVEVSEPSKKPIIPFFPNFNFNFQIPQFPFPQFLPKNHRHHDDDKNKETPKLQIEGGQPGPNVVTFPKSQQEVVVPSVQTEADAHTSIAKTSNPLILYQVYALGAYFLSRWIWARWNERKARGGSSDEDNN